MNDPYSRRLHLTPDDRAAWAHYEAASKAAAEQYRAIPTSLHHAGFTAACVGCGKTTANPGGKCRDCRKAGKSPNERKALRKAAKS